MKLLDFFKTEPFAHGSTLQRTILRFEKCIQATYKLIFPYVTISSQYLKKILKKGITSHPTSLTYLFPLIPDELFLRINLEKPGKTPFDDNESALSFVLFQKLFDLRQNILQTQQQEVVESILGNFLDYVTAFYISWDTDLKEETVLEILTTLRIAAQHTYEDEKPSLGVLVSEQLELYKKKGPNVYLGLFNRELLETKRFLKIVDGWNTLYITNTDGVLLDIGRVEDLAGTKKNLDSEDLPISSPFLFHAQCTRPKGNICFLLNQSGHIFIFKYGKMLLEFTTGEWTQKRNHEFFQSYSKVVNHPELSRLTYQLSLELSIKRRGGILILLNNPNHLNKILYKQDTMSAFKNYEGSEKSLPEDLKQSTTRKGNILVDLWSDPKFNKNLIIQYLFRNKNILDIPMDILINIASIDGALVCDREGNLLAFGAIIKNIRNDKRLKILGEGSRYVAGMWASKWGATLEISSDGNITFFNKQQKVWSE